VMEDRSLHTLFRDVGGHVVPFASLGERASVFLNVNTPDDRARAEASLRGLPATVRVTGKKKSGRAGS